MNVFVESSLVIRWLRRVVSTSKVCAFLVALARPVLRAAHRLEGIIARGVTSRDETAALARVTVVVEDSRLLTSVERCLTLPSVAWRHATTGGCVEAALHQARALEPWQRVRLIGWMLFVAVLTYRLLVGFSDPSIRSVDLIVWGGMLALALGLMWGCRDVALAWVHWVDTRACGRAERQPR